MIVKTCLPRFINTFIETAADYRERIHIQSDLEDAGFELGQLKRLVSKFGNQSELLQQELAIWDRSYIEVCACPAARVKKMKGVVRKLCGLEWVGGS